MEKQNATITNVPCFTSSEGQMKDKAILYILETDWWKNLGPVVQSVVSLTSSLRVISLSVLVESIYNMLKFFAEKMWVAFALQKLLTFFFSKKFQHICVSLDVNFNESLTNNVVSFEQLGPDCYTILQISYGFVRVELRFYHPVNPLGSCWAWPVYLTTLFLGRLSPMQLTGICAHSFTRNWIIRREGMTVENISPSISTKECCRTPVQIEPATSLSPIWLIGWISD